MKTPGGAIRPFIAYNYIMVKIFISQMEKEKSYRSYKW